PDAQVFAYSWIDESATPVGAGPISLSNPIGLVYGALSEAYTQENGLRLAAAVQQALGPDFFTNKGLIHILGHSHGSKVATVATLALQQAQVPVAVSQLTTFESPEDGPAPLGTNFHLAGLIGAQNFLWYYMQQMALSNSPVMADRTPILQMGTPETFIDNYFSILGFGDPFDGYTGLSSVADVFLNSLVLYPLPSMLSDTEKVVTPIFVAH